MALMPIAKTSIPPWADIIPDGATFTDYTADPITHAISGTGSTIMNEAL